MNFSIFFGILAAIGTIYLGVFKSVSDPGFYLDQHALIVVLGGTLSAAMIAFPFTRLGEVVSNLAKGFFHSRLPDYKVVEELYDAALYFRKYKEIVTHVEFSHPFLVESFDLMKSGAFNEKQLRDILANRIVGFKKVMQSDAKILNALAKFPPAFGLLGASTGMIAMMINLNKGGSASIGPAMAIALVATFWGIAVANLLLLPLADYANKIAQDDSHTRLIIMEGILLIKRNEEPHVIVEILRSHLPQADRKKVKAIRNWAGPEKSKAS